MNIAKSIGIRGPCCIQMKETHDSEPQLVEVNARLEVAQYSQHWLERICKFELILDLVGRTEISIPKISEVTVIRYFEEIVVHDPLGPRIASNANNAYWIILKAEAMLAC